MKNLQNALVTIRRSPYQSLLAIFMVSVTFLVGFVFSLVVMGTGETLNFFETRPQVIAFFELEVEERAVSDLATKMEQKSYVKEVSVVSKQEALKYYQEDNKDNPLLLELVTADILPASIEVSAASVESLQQIQDDLRASKGVEEVVYQEDIVSNLKVWTNSIRIIGLVATGILGLVSFLVIVVLISMKVVTKRFAIKTMRVIGATNWFITGPFVFEGMIYGAVGSLVGWMGMYALLIYATPWLQDFMGSILVLPLPIEVVAIQAGIGLLIGMFLGAMASYVAVRRIVKQR